MWDTIPNGIIAQLATQPDVTVAYILKKESDNAIKEWQGASLQNIKFWTVKIPLVVACGVKLISQYPQELLMLSDYVKYLE